MASQKKLTKLSWKNREEFATFAKEILTKLDLGDGLQLTIAISQDGYVGACAIPAITDYSDT